MRRELPELTEVNTSRFALVSAVWRPSARGVGCHQSEAYTAAIYALTLWNTPQLREKRGATPLGVTMTELGEKIDADVALEGDAGLGARHGDGRFAGVS